jgi:ABC-2 type transport system ATP-binding protein
MSVIVKNICKSYDNIKALDNISFELKKGDIVGFLGPNGAGKSTLMKILTSYVKEDSGSVIICDINKNDNSIFTKSKIGYLSENNPLYKDMFVQEYLFFISDLLRIENKKDRINYLLNRVGLENVKNQKIADLSKGFKQRVGIAAALVHDPEIILLDEPTTGLDPNQLIEIRSLIKEIGKEKIILLSTHIMEEIPKICNRVLVINKGKLVDNKPIDEMKKANTNFEEYFYKLTN